MDIFTPNQPANLLPYDGTVNYYGKIMPSEGMFRYLEVLLDNIDWKHDEAKIFGKHIVTKRMVAWYGDDDFSYTYSNTTRHSLPWTKELLELKALCEESTGHTFNSCLLNLYHNGDEGMAWHSDDEKSLGKDTAIASMSFGAERKFKLKHRQSKYGVSINLESGSLLIMKGATQTHWLHCLPKSKRVKGLRINLTFRTYIMQG
ncbi:MAG: alpha-ketoglutarate-dependent dioxygenase AlkB [Daejeonella sp.]